jgi:hypothetical protein
MTPRCEFFWVVRCEFWLPQADVEYLFDIAIRARREPGPSIGLLTLLHGWLTTIGDPRVLETEGVAALVSLIGDRDDRPMLKKILTEALRIMRENPRHG